MKMNVFKYGDVVVARKSDYGASSFDGNCGYRLVVHVLSSLPLPHFPYLIDGSPPRLRGIKTDGIAEH